MVGGGGSGLERERSVDVVVNLLQAIGGGMGETE